MVTAKMKSNDEEPLLDEDWKNTTEYKDWLRQRDRNKYIAYALIFLAGLEIQAVSITMIYYLTDRFRMPVSKARSSYSMAETFCAIGQVAGNQNFYSFICYSSQPFGYWLFTNLRIKRVTMTSGQ